MYFLNFSVICLTFTQLLWMIDTPHYFHVRVHVSPLYCQINAADYHPLNSTKSNSTFHITCLWSLSNQTEFFFHQKTSSYSGVSLSNKRLHFTCNNTERCSLPSVMYKTFSVLIKGQFCLDPEFYFSHMQQWGSWDTRRLISKASVSVMCSNIKYVSFWCHRKMFFWCFPHIECKWVAFSFMYDPYPWQCELIKMQKQSLSGLRDFLTLWSSPVHEPGSFLQCTYQSGRFTLGPFCMSRLLQLFVTPWQDSSACSSAATKALWARALSLWHASFSTAEDTVVYVRVCASASMVLCTFACWKVRVKVLLLEVGPLCRQFPELANRKQQAERETLDAARVSVSACMK